METDYNSELQNKLSRTSLQVALDHEMPEVRHRMETRRLFGRAARMGQDYFRGYVDGWGDGFRLFLKYFMADNKDIKKHNDTRKH